MSNTHLFFLQLIMPGSLCFLQHSLGLLNFLELRGNPKLGRSVHPGNLHSLVATFTISSSACTLQNLPTLNP